MKSVDEDCIKRLAVYILKKRNRSHGGKSICREQEHNANSCHKNERVYLAGSINNENRPCKAFKMALHGRFFVHVTLLYRAKGAVKKRPEKIRDSCKSESRIIFLI